MVVSFCVIAYNAEFTLPRLFSDLEKQTYPHELMEIVLVDSMSTDRTRQIMQDFLDKATGFHRVVILQNPKKTLPCGWNVALKELTGDVVLRVDAHTLIPQDFVAKNMACIEKGEKICGGRVISLQKEHTLWGDMLLEAENSMFGGGYAVFRRSKRAQYTTTLAFASYRKEVFNKVGYYNESLARTEDNEMHYRMRQAGFKFYLNPEIISYRYARSSFGKLLKQKYLNGYWIGLTLGVCPKCFSLFHFAPLALVLAIIVSFMLLLVGHTLPIVLLLSIYIGCTLLMTMLSIIRNKFNLYYFLLPVVFMSLHFSYGIGTLIGILKMPFLETTNK